MNYFTAIPDAQAITLSKGVYRQVPVFQRDSKIYARHGNGFIRLMQGGTSSHPNVRWAELDAAETGYTEQQGSVTVANPIKLVAAE